MEIPRILHNLAFSGLQIGTSTLYLLAALTEINQPIAFDFPHFANWAVDF